MKYEPIMGVVIAGNLIHPEIVSKIKRNLPQDNLAGIRTIVCSMAEGITKEEHIEDLVELMGLYGKSRKAGISIEELLRYVEGIQPKSKVASEKSKTKESVIPKEPNKVHELPNKSINSKVNGHAVATTSARTSLSPNKIPSMSVDRPSKIAQKTKPKPKSPSSNTRHSDYVITANVATLREARKIGLKLRQQKKGAGFIAQKLATIFPELKNINQNQCKKLLN